MESKLNQLASDLVRQLRRSPVLHYATPLPAGWRRRALVARLTNAFERHGGLFWRGVQVLGIGMFVGGSFLRPGLFGLFVAMAGVMLVLASRVGRTVRDLNA
jgi:hypothetical protein